jgi:hypothetical protein
MRFGSDYHIPCVIAEPQLFAGTRRFKLGRQDTKAVQTCEREGASASDVDTTNTKRRVCQLLCTNHCRNELTYALV